MKISAPNFNTDARRRQALEETRAAGRMGCSRVPLAVTMDESLSDTFVGRLPAALAFGQEQRSRNDEYMYWLAANADRLAAQVMESGADDGGAWLRQQYTIETGREP